MADTKKFLAFSCTHTPLHDPEAIDWLVDKISEYRPDTVIHLGDGMEADSASRWPSEATWDLEDEFIAHNTILERIRRAAPSKADLVYIQGNHCENISRIGRLNPKIRSLCDYRKYQSEFNSGNWKHPVKYVYNKANVYWVGQIGFCHGFKTGTGGDEAQALTLGKPYSLMVFGHTHRPTDISQASKGDILLPYYYGNVGTMRDMETAEYMTRKDRSRWGQAVILGETKILERASFVKNWDAELVIRKMYDE